MTKSPQPPASRLDSGKGTAHVRLSAPAKINLYLEVLGRRDDGYHELITVLQTIDLADVVEIQIRERRPAIPAGNADISFALTGDSGALRTAATGDGQEPINAGRVPDGAENLAVRAAMAWLHAAGRQDELGINLRLHLVDLLLCQLRLLEARDLLFLLKYYFHQITFMTKLQTFSFIKFIKNVF